MGGWGELDGADAIQVLAFQKDIIFIKFEE